MKNLLLMTLVLSNLAFAQDDAHKHHSMSKGHGKKMEMKEHKHGAANDAFNKVLVKYEGLHKSFFDNDIAKIKINAKAVLEEIEAIKDEKIAKTLNYTKKKLSEISKSDDIKANKEAMNTVSQGILVVLEKHAPNKNYARYYCPMVKKYWIQNISDSEKVMNPYASDSMPHCGGKQ